MPYVITGACVDVMDRSCLNECPVDCIKPGERMLYINPDECIDCAACEPTCPQDAIHLDEDLPADSEAYRCINADFFTSPDFGPAGDDREQAVDHPVVAALPRP